MHKARHLAPVLGLYRHHIAAAPLGDDALLQMLLVLLGVHQLVQLVPGPGRGVPNLPPDIGQSRGGGVSHLLLADNAGKDFLLQILVGGEHREPVSEGSPHAR